jgi:UDP-N-acetylmuramyl tripeptide synthase
VVTGTNGKTTTSHMLAAILSRAGRRPLRNASGSNLSRGVAGALAARADARGRLRLPPAGEGPQGPLVGLFETDEAAFARVVPAVRPDVVVVTNLFRDQLDRYGEVDTVATIWRSALAALDAGGARRALLTLALNADDPTVAALSPPGVGATLTYGIGDARWGHPGLEHAADAKVCPACGARLEYPVCFYGHLGHYRCANGHARPDPDVCATRLELHGFEGTDLTLTSPAGEIAFRLPLPGLYNVYNALAAATGALALGLSPPAIREGLATFSAAFGRLERAPVGPHTVTLVLAKNPVGMNEALRTLFSDGASRHLLLALNDLDADGRDVSWVWDADFEQVAGHARSVTVSGRRAEDLALRLKYAGVGSPRSEVRGLRSEAGPPLSEGRAGSGADEMVIEPDLERALDLALAALPSGETLYCVLTYTAMLALRRVLTERGHLAPYWQDQA